MKRLNKKGFTLIELLAVIVVLAIVLVVTIPAVLSSMEQARREQFKNAVKTVEEYAKKQIAACQVGDIALVPYNTDIFEEGSSCTLIDTESNDNNAKILLESAGYTYQYEGVGDCDNANNTADFCGIILDSDGNVTDVVSPKGSKFGKKDIRD